MTSIHQWGAWVTIAVTGIVGLWGIVGGLRETQIGIPYRAGIGLAVATTSLHIATGAILYSQGATDPGDQHLFYGVVIAFTMAFAYIFRAQLELRPLLRWGMFWLFVMGLGLRTVQTYGIGF
ncbi:MAG: hypothetical protein GEU79_00805 [Acidimicrobiia bacterium]|nr:hypothetical protein [Acidimicrobiia bacterium]